MRVRHMLYHLS